MENHRDITKDNQWGIFHKIHSLSNLSHGIRLQSLSAIERFDVEIESCVIDFRCILEEIVNRIFNEITYRSQKEKTLSEKIYFLFNEKIISKRVRNIMINLKNWGNRSVHKYEVDENIISDAYLKDFFELLDYANINMK